MTCDDCIRYPACVFHLTGHENEKCPNFLNKANLVEVVRCKDCRCWDEVGTDPVTNYRFGFCRHYQWQDAEGWEKETNGQDFCSYGERKEQE